MRYPPLLATSMSAIPKINFSLIMFTVPVEAAYQVWRVTRVLSMGKVDTHVQGVPEKSCKIKPWEIFEKMQF